jgi:hypothetical protein
VLDDERLKLNKRFGEDYEFNEYDVLANAGQVKATVARQLAEEEYAKFRVI